MKIPTIHSSGNFYRQKHQNVTRKILGFVISSEDLTVKQLNWRRNLIIDSEYLVPHSNAAYNSSLLVVMIDHDFVQKYYEIYFFGYMDILSIIGGLNASIAPILGMLSPIFIINYLYQLSKIILGKYER